MTRTGGQLLVEALAAEAVTTVFGVPGVQLDWAVEALRERRDAIRFIVPSHEQAASYMADGYARATGKVGVCMVVPGPGLLNAMSGLATAYATCSPVLCIVGQIDSASIGLEQGRLHEIVDQSNVLGAVTKWHRLVRSPEEIPAAIAEAFHELRSGIPRPVCLEVPPDVLQATTDVKFGRPSRPVTRVAPDPAQTARIAARLLSARLPVILAGRGATAAGGPAALQRLAERLDAIVVMSDGGRGALADSHPLALPPAALASVLPLADAVLAVGTRFLSTPGTPRPTAEGAFVCHVNLEPAHLRPPRPADEIVTADAVATLKALVDSLGQRRGDHGASTFTATARQLLADRMAKIQPQTAWLDALRAALPEDGILVTDLTQVGYLANVSFPVNRPDQLLSAGYQGTLGAGFATALGAAAGANGRRVVSVSGDGGFAYTLQELSTAKRFGLGVVAIVFADGRYGNVHRIQSRVFGETYATELDNPDYAALAHAFGVDHRRVETPDGLATAIASADGVPLLVEVPVGEMASPWPAVIGTGAFAEPALDHTTQPEPAE
ncbi:thiamine pyrophosphate-binding protein [Amorphus sp. 3PC139-8]|uniref:thiamine pyrophosphate-binding protein n=1 Tax=Amorphus sp. 3PC139-8 TaxID=2735676 RepID=UPI00345C6266